MKKIIALILAVATLASVGAVAGAASETVLTTTVPAATYTLNIPANQEIPFGATQTDIGNVTVTESSGFASGKNLNVTLTYDAFKCEGVSTTIPFSVVGCITVGYENPKKVDIPSGSEVIFAGRAGGTVYEAGGEGGSSVKYSSFAVNIDSNDWGKALAGEYSATITFTAEVVVETTT